MCIADRVGRGQKAEAVNALPALMWSVVAPVLHWDSRWDTSLVEAKFMLVSVADERPRKYIGSAPH